MNDHLTPRRSRHAVKLLRNRYVEAGYRYRLLAKALDMLRPSVLDYPMSKDTYARDLDLWSARMQALGTIGDFIDDGFAHIEGGEDEAAEAPALAGDDSEPETVEPPAPVAEEERDMTAGGVSRSERYAENMREMGHTQIKVWIPSDAVEWAYRWAEDMRTLHEHGMPWQPRLPQRILNRPGDEALSSANEQGAVLRGAAAAARRRG